LFEVDRVICTPHLGASTKEAQTNVAVAVAEQIVNYLKYGTVVNAVNAPPVTGDVLAKIGALITLGDRLGCLLAQLAKKPVQEVQVDYVGDFQDNDLSPVTTAILKGLLTPAVKDGVNFVNAQVLAKERGINVKVTSTPETAEYINLIGVRAISGDETNKVAGTIFGKKNPRVVNINNFRLEMNPQGRFILIHNIDKPGAIGSIGTLLGKNQINISRMRVGQEEGGDKTMIFLRTDDPISDEVLEQMRALPLMISVNVFEL